MKFTSGRLDGKGGTLANDTAKRVYGYLINARHISPHIVSHFVRTGALYESRETHEETGKTYHNAVFVGADKDGQQFHAHKRSLYGGVSNPHRMLNAGGSRMSAALKLRYERIFGLHFSRPLHYSGNYGNGFKDGIDLIDRLRYQMLDGIITRHTDKMAAGSGINVVGFIQVSDD